MTYEKYDIGNEAKRGDIAEKEIMEMLAMGVVVESHSRWTCLVSNADGLIMFFPRFQLLIRVDKLAV